MDSLSPLPPLPLPFILLLLTALTYLTYTHLLHPLYLSPLSRIPPAHWSAPLSPAWILYKRWTFQNNRATHEAHERLGPIVRLGPKEVSVNCVDGGIRTVYGGGWDKHAWYEFFGTYGVYSMFSMTGSKVHAARKRLMSNIYSKSFLQTSPHLKQISKEMIGRRFLPLVDTAAGLSAPIDVLDMNSAFTLDFITAYLYGLPVATNATQDLKFRDKWLHDYQCRKPFEFYHQEVPNLTKWLTRFGLSPIPKFSDEANRWLENWCLEMSDGAEKWLDSTDLSSEPVVYKQLRSGMVKQRAKMNGDLESSKEQDKAAFEQQRLQIAAEMYDQLTAGQETSAVALTYLQWELSKHPELQKRLREELLTLEPQIKYPLAENAAGEAELPESKSIDALPLLHAIVMETLRLHAPIPGLQPRISPAVNSSKPTVLAGVSDIPANIRVNAQAWSLHRNEEVFPHALEFIPDRWLEAADSQHNLEEMKRWFWAFGSGGRMCVGSNLATQEIKLIVAAIYANFTSEIVDDGINGSGMEPLDAYTIKPLGDRLILRFTRV